MATLNAPCRVTLYREVNHKKRYYRVSLLLNLFGEYIFQIIYGSCERKKPTRVIEEYFKTYAEAYRSLELKLKEKYKKGYRRERVKKRDHGLS
ncbi:WGR domain-containing protein [Sulfurimonas sp.]